MSLGFVLAPTNVSHERLEDEVIIINVATGAYISGTGSAADLWSLIVAGHSAESAAKLLAETYSADEAVVRSDIEPCLAGLLAMELIAPATGAQSPDTSTLPEGERGVWSAPTFDEYTDMWDLLKYDPIHDVNETGWPYAAPIAKK